MSEKVLDVNGLSLEDLKKFACERAVTLDMILYHAEHGQGGALERLTAIVSMVKRDQGEWPSG